MDVVVQKPKSKMLTDVEVDIIRDFMFTHKDELESLHAAGVQERRGGPANCGRN